MDVSNTEIQSVKTTALRNDSHFQFNKSVLALIAETGPDSLKIRPQYDAYIVAFNKEDAVLKKIVKSDKTEKIAALDKERDHKYSAIVAMNKASLQHHSEEVVEAAKRLGILFKTYGNINRKSLLDQTSALYNLLQELKGTYKNDVALTRIKDWTDDLERINNELEALMKERFDHEFETADIALKTARKATDDAYQAVRKQVGALVLVYGAADYEAFIGKVNLLIDQFKKMVKQTKPRK